MAACFELKDAVIGFGERQILGELNLQVSEGEKIAVLGPSGQGKSLFLKTLASLHPLSRGELWVRGGRWADLKDHEQVSLRQKMGMLFQKNALFDSMTVRENVAFPLRETTRLRHQEINDKVEAYVEAVGLSHALDLMPSEISGGMQKRLGIARALALEPEILLYDDPTAGLDPSTSRKIVQLIDRLQGRKNSTVVMVTNEVNRALDFADRLFFVQGGRVLDLGSSAQALASTESAVRQFLYPTKKAVASND